MLTVRTNLLFCLAAIVAVALWAANRPAPSQLHIRLVLSKQPVQPAFVEGDCISLEVQNRQVHLSSRKNGISAQSYEPTLTPDQQAELYQELSQAGAWELNDIDSKEPESKVLYTFFEVQLDNQPAHASHWRGLPPNSPQDRCAQALLRAPFGGKLKAAMQGL